MHLGDVILGPSSNLAHVHRFNLHHKFTAPISSEYLHCFFSKQYTFNEFVNYSSVRSVSQLCDFYFFILSANICFQSVDFFISKQL